ncbi:MAG: hypothetical protein IPL61_24650 [Myxococcales bacterium]|nr:hypothetical protein [Myxococcales bacterium]
MSRAHARAIARAVAIVSVATGACRDRRPGAEPAETAPPPPAAGECVALPYQNELDVPEASGAAWLAGPGRLLVVADSGHDGEYIEVDAAGAIEARGQLPLGTAGDDLEGLALDGDRVWGLTSAGWLRAWRRTDAGYTLEVSYALDDACPPTSVNCGANFEGLCLAPRPLADGCDGYAASKQAGRLVCLHRQGDRYALDRARGYDVSGSGKLADCAIAADGTVWTGDNGFGLGAVRQWAIGADGPTLVGATRLGIGFPEVLAFGPDHAVYRFSDLGGSPSLAAAFQCPTGLPKAGPGDAGG